MEQKEVLKKLNNPSHGSVVVKDWNGLQKAVLSKKTMSIYIDGYITCEETIELHPGQRLIGLGGIAGLPDDRQRNKKSGLLMRTSGQSVVILRDKCLVSDLTIKVVLQAEKAGSQPYYGTLIATEEAMTASLGNLDLQIDASKGAEETTVTVIELRQKLCRFSLWGDCFISSSKKNLQVIGIAGQVDNNFAKIYCTGNINIFIGCGIGIDNAKLEINSGHLRIKGKDISCLNACDLLVNGDGQIDLCSGFEALSQMNSLIMSGSAKMNILLLPSATAAIASSDIVLSGSSRMMIESDEIERSAILRSNITLQGCSQTEVQMFGSHGTVIGGGSKLETSGNTSFKSRVRRTAIFSDQKSTVCCHSQKPVVWTFEIGRFQRWVGRCRLQYKAMRF